MNFTEHLHDYFEGEGIKVVFDNGFIAAGVIQVKELGSPETIYLHVDDGPRLLVVEMTNDEAAIIASCLARALAKQLLDEQGVENDIFGGIKEIKKEEAK